MLVPGFPASQLPGFPALIFAILMMAVVGCATNKGLSSADRLKIENDLTYLESFLLAKEQTSSNTRWRSVADEIASVRAQSYDICSSTYGRSTLSQVFNASRQLNTDTHDINKRITELESYIGYLPQKHLPFVYINRLNDIKSRSHTYTSRQKEELIYVINVLEKSFSTDCQEALSSHSFIYPIISPQLLCESVPIGRQKNHNDLITWFRSNSHLLNKDSIRQLEKDEGIAVDLGVGRVVMINDTANKQPLLIVESALSISILFIANNEQESYSSNPYLWVGKTCQLKGEITEIQRNHTMGCMITLNLHGGDFSNVCNSLVRN